MFDMRREGCRLTCVICIDGYLDMYVGRAKVHG